MSSNLRHWVLLLSCASTATLVGNVLMFNLAVTYGPARNVLPEQYQVNKTFDWTKDHFRPDTRKKRIIDTEFDQGLRKYLDSKTTAHPIPLKGEFLNAQTTKAPPTRKTRRPPKPKSPASILTNPNVPIKTTTAFQQATTTPLLEKVNSTTQPKPTNADETMSKAMRNQENLNIDDTAALNKSKLLERDWATFAVDSWIFMGPGVGMLVGYVPMSYLIHHKSARITIGAALFFSFVFTALQMKIITMGVIYVCVLRFLQGLTCAPLLAFIGTNASNWATLKEQLLFLTCSFSSILFAPILPWGLIYLVAPADEGIELHIAHYIVAAATLLLALFWLLFYRDFPPQHKWVNGEELNRIATGKVLNNRLDEERNIFPLLLKSASTWSMLIASFGYFSAFALIANFLPVYLFKTTKNETDASVLIVFVFTICVHGGCFIFNKFMCGCSNTAKVRIFNTIAFVLSAIIFIAMAASPVFNNSNNIISSLLMIVLIPLGLSTSGFIQGTVIYGRFYTQHIISNMQLPFALSMTLVPFFVVFMSIDGELRYWRFIFLITGALILLSNIVFAFLVRGEPASWAENTWDPSVSYKMRDMNLVSRNEECGLLELRRLDSQTEQSQETNVDQY